MARLNPIQESDFIENEFREYLKDTFNFSDKEDLRSIGHSKFAPRSANNRELVTPPAKFTVQQGMLEMSNSSVIREMLNTIQTSRNYESLGKVITENSTLLDSAISVGRIRG